MTSTSGLLSQYISEAESITDAESTVNGIQAVVNGEVIKINGSLNSMITIVMIALTTKIYDDPIFDENTVHFSLPNIDFLDIAKLWMQYLMNNSTQTRVMEKALE